MADEGLLHPDDVTVALVLPKTPAAKAVITVQDAIEQAEAPGKDLRRQVAQLVSPPGSGENLYPHLPGLMVGDVIERDQWAAADDERRRPRPEADRGPAA